MVELHGITCVTLSYIMGWNDKLNVCENLSITIVGEIIAPIITYAISKTVENVFEKNKLSFSTPLQAVDNFADDPQEAR
jgi:Mn2+/Fe2+ NRAMP family transporter